MALHMKTARTGEITLEAEAPIMALSADTHVGPRMQDLRPYCPQGYLEAFDQFCQTRLSKASVQGAIFEQTFSEEYRHGRALNLQTTGHYDADVYLRDMDHEGVAGAVVFHNSLNGEPLPFDIAHGLRGIPPEQHENVAAGRQMYNRWLADFCATQPGRTIGLAYLPLWDADASIAELEWCAEHGLGGINYPAPGQPGMLPPDASDSDRLFAACADLDMTLTTHIGSVAPIAAYDNWEVRNPRSFQFGLMDAGDWGVRTVSSLVIFGAFERHPNLKLVLTEVPGVFWNELAIKMDSLHESPLRRAENSLKRPPSEYMATNVWLGNSFQSRQEATAAIDIGRSDRFCWGSDYPHPEGTFSYSDDADQCPMTRLSLAFTYHDLPLNHVRKLVGENLLNAYPRFDEAVLHDAAERVGMGAAEISTAPDLDKHEYIRTTGTMAFRVHGPWS